MPRLAWASKSSCASSIAKPLPAAWGQAKDMLLIADRAVWIWNALQDRFSEARQRLNLYHGDEHLWAVPMNSPAKAPLKPGNGSLWMNLSTKKSKPKST